MKRTRATAFRGDSDTDADTPDDDADVAIARQLDEWHALFPVPAELYCLIVCRPHKTTTQRPFHILLAGDPFGAVSQHNQQRSRATDMHDAAPFCYIEQVAGPLPSDESGMQFAHQLVHGCRGLPSLCRRMEELATAHGVPCYSARVPLDEAVPGYVERAGLSPVFVETARTFERAARILARV